MSRHTCYYVFKKSCLWGCSKPRRNTVLKCHFSPCGLHMDYFSHTECWDQFTPACVHGSYMFLRTGTPTSARWCESCKYQLSTNFMQCLWYNFIANTTYHFLALQTNSSNHFALKADLIRSYSVSLITKCDIFFIHQALNLEL